jgi:hypothetical protein
MTQLLSPWSELAKGVDAGRLALDRLTLNLRHNADECWLEYSHAGGLGGRLVQGEPQSLRFLLRSGDAPIRLTPRLADRPVVARPLTSTELPPGERATLLVSTVLWARIEIGAQVLAELPTLRPSDTWFGPDTLEGELCYASQTRARLHMNNVQVSAFRAITPVSIRNDGDDNLKLERLNVPVPHLTLYCDGTRFWTSALSVVREENLATAKLRIEASPPPRAITVAPPRRPIRGGVFDRAINLLFA